MTITANALSRTLVALLLVLSIALSASAQFAEGVPISGHTGTMALPGNVDQIYAGVNKLVVKTTDGIDHVFNVTKTTHVHGFEALSNLPRGTPVVVHYTESGNQRTADEIDSLGPDGLKTTEGTIAAVDRVRKIITVKYASGATERLRLTHHALSEGGAVKGNRVIVYYTDESGQKVAHYFKRKS
ncbi:MAG TPA: hypothetical protein VLV86_11930 [Vicinamibacterales bacterium]|nr:hypothetical protein [Vicinamibacterales bacterium]